MLENGGAFFDGRHDVNIRRGNVIFEFDELFGGSWSLICASSRFHSATIATTANGSNRSFGMVRTPRARVRARIQACPTP